MIIGNHHGHHLATAKVSSVDTSKADLWHTVTVMVTKRRNTLKRPIYLREWRKHVGVKAAVLAEALEIEEKSYYRLEREAWRLDVPDLDILADVLKIQPHQFWRRPSTGKDNNDISLDQLIEDQPAAIKLMTIKAVKGMVGK